MTDDKLTVESVTEELQSAIKWFGEHGKNTNTGVIAICQHAIDLINRQKAELENARAEIATEYADKLQRYILDNCCITSDDVDGIWKQINEIVKGHTENQTE